MLTPLNTFTHKERTMTENEYNALKSAVKEAFSAMTDEQITAMLKEQNADVKKMLNDPAYAAQVYAQD